VPTDALREPWLPKLLAATGNATVVGWAPESQVYVPQERLVEGTIPFIAWQSPLPGEAGEEGVAYWMPPFSAVLLGGSEERFVPVRQLLEMGGMKCRRISDSAQVGSFTALLISCMAALEASGWSLRTFRGE